MSYKIAWVKPMKGMKVPRPLSNRLIPERGAEVPLNPYWMRRIKDGDVEVAKKPVTKKTTKTKTDKDDGGQS